jgi:hypothetical protein
MRIKSDLFEKIFLTFYFSLLFLYSHELKITVQQLFILAFVTKSLYKYFIIIFMFHRKFSCEQKVVCSMYCSSKKFPNYSHLHLGKKVQIRRNLRSYHNLSNGISHISHFTIIIYCFFFVLLIWKFSNEKNIIILSLTKL